MANGEEKVAGAAAEAKARNYGVWWATILPVALGALLLAGFAWKVGLGKFSNPWHGLLALGALVIISLVAATGLRFIMDPLARPVGAAPAAPPDPTDLARSRIAPFVLALGGAAIIVLTLGLVVTFGLLASMADDPAKPLGPLAGKIDTVLLGIFGAVLPIVATWVGTVIAFYFTTESYRQAAAATLEASAGLRPAGPRVTSIMKPYDEIIEKIPVLNRTDADKVLIKDILPLFEKVTRVMIFEDKAKNPVYIIRKKLVPEDLKTSDTADVAAYRAKSPDLAADSKRFGFLAETATAVDAKRIMQDNRFEDLFVTHAGQPTEAVLGWVSDDMVKDV